MVRAINHLWTYDETGPWWAWVREPRHPASISHGSDGPPNPGLTRGLGKVGIEKTYYGEGIKIRSGSPKP